MVADISVANLIAYLKAAWNAGIAAAPASIEAAGDKNPKALLTIRRRMPNQTWIAANVKQIEDIFEIVLSHATETAIDHLIDLLLTYPLNQAYNLVPVRVSEPIELGTDTAGNHVWTVQFTATRWA